MPVHGKCPSCGSALHWQDVVRSSWRRHDHSTTPIKATRKSKKALAALEESDNSDDDLFLDAETAALVEKDEDAGERVMVEEAEKEASFDAGYLWQPDEAGEDERESEPEGAPKKRSSSSASSEGSAKRRGRPPKARSITPEPVEPKRRGRPPKPRTRSPAEDVPSPDQEAPQPFKRPVGRPRKSMIDLSSDPSPLSAPGKRKVRAPTPPPARVDTSSPLPDILSTVSPSLSPKKRSKPLNGTVPLSTPTEIGKRFSAIELSSSPIPASKPKAGAKAKAKKKETQVVIEISD